MDSERKFFDGFDGVLESLARAYLRQMVSTKLERLRSDDPDEWFSMRASLSKLGPYDRVDKINDLTESIAEDLPRTEKNRPFQARKYANIILEALEAYFEEHGVQSGRPNSKESAEQILPVHEAVEKLLESMEITWSEDELQ